MAKVRRRLAVIDTNVFVANFLARSPDSHNRRVIRSWLAVAAKTRFVVTNDRDLLDVDAVVQQKFGLEILKPGDYLKQLSRAS